MAKKQSGRCRVSRSVQIPVVVGFGDGVAVHHQDDGEGAVGDAEEVAGKDILAKRSAINGDEMDDDEISIENLIGWAILGKRGEKIGEITDFEPIPGNPCLYVNTGEETVMIPLHDDFIVDIDEEGGNITLDLPEGLI